MRVALCRPMPYFQPVRMSTRALTTPIAGSGEAGSVSAEMENRHTMIDERLRGLHVAIAGKIQQNPLLLEKARKNVERELGRCSANTAPYLERWREILSQPLEVITLVITGRGEEETALRQSSPFSGILTPRERWAIMRQFQAHHKPFAPQ